MIIYKSGVRSDRAKMVVRTALFWCDETSQPPLTQLTHGREQPGPAEVTYVLWDFSTPRTFSPSDELSVGRIRTSTAPVSWEKMGTAAGGSLAGAFLLFSAWLGVALFEDIPAVGSTPDIIPHFW